MSEFIYDQPEEEYRHVLKPTSALVFGIMGICFAVWGIGGTLLGYLMRFVMSSFLPVNKMQHAMQLPIAYEIPSVFINMCLQIFLLVIGIMLLKASLKAVKGFLIYCVIDIILVPIMMIYPAIHTIETFQKMPQQLPMMAPIMVVGMAFGLLFALAFPVAGLIFMTRPSVKKLYEAYNHPQNMANPANAQNV